jgi:undecaprenyl-diphosphatase
MFVASIIAFVRAHQEFAYGLVLFAALAEALPVIGVIFPGETIVLGISALAATGAVHLLPLLMVTTIGAIAGDGISYWLGRHYHRAIVETWPLSRYPALIAQGEDFFQRHGGKSIFIARFTPGVRAIVPLIAGTLSMPPARFYLLNVLSAVIWGLTHVLVGAAVGASLVLVGAVAGRLMMFVLVLIALFSVVTWAIRAAVRRLPAVLAAAQEQLRRWAQSQHTWLGRQLLSVLDPSRKELPGLVFLGALLVGSLWVFMGIMQDVLAGDPLVRADMAVFQLLQDLRTGWADRIMVGITELGDATVIIAVTLATLAWLAWRRNWRGMIYETAAVAIASLFTSLLKITLQQSRPHPLAPAALTFSFPSGHTAVSMALYGFLAIIVAWEASRRWQLAVATAAGLLVAAIAFSRIYLGAHWLSDVLAGLAFGLAWASLLAIAYLRRTPPRVGAIGLSAAALVSLVLAGTLHIEGAHAVDMQRYAVRTRLQIMPQTQWWSEGWQKLPARRIDLIGGLEEPLTFQWAGTIGNLKRALFAHGWVAPVPWSLQSGFSWLLPHAAVMSLPVLPHLESGHQERLVLVHPVPGDLTNRRLVLRLWQSNVELGPPGTDATPLWIGTVIEERSRRIATLLTLLQNVPDYDGPRQALGAALGAHRLAMRGPSFRQAGWDGGVLLGQAH